MPKPRPRFPERVTRPRSSPGAQGKGDAPREGFNKRAFDEGWERVFGGDSEERMEFAGGVTYARAAWESRAVLPDGRTYLEEASGAGAPTKQYRPPSSIAFDRWVGNPSNEPDLAGMISVSPGALAVKVLRWGRRCFEAGRMVGCNRRHTEPRR